MITPARKHELWRLPAAEIVSEYGSFCRDQFSGNNGVPVVIAARNEEADLPATLLALADSKYPVRPVVVENGSNDKTASYARSMGAITLYSDIAQKMAALQLGVNTVLEKRSHQTVLFTDADTLIGKNWAKGMREKAQVPDAQPVVVCGSTILAQGGSRVANCLRTARLLGKDVTSSITHKNPGPHGNNMAIRFDEDGSMQAAYNDIPGNLFIGEEKAICDAAMRSNGVVTSSIGLSTLVVTKGDRFGGLKDLLGELKGHTNRADRYPEYNDFMPYTPGIEMPTPLVAPHLSIEPIQKAV